VHGATAARTARGGSVGEADAIVTRTPGLPLAVVTADCLPVVLYDPVAGALGVAHVGWRGTVADTAGAAVAALTALGAAPPRILAAIGPSIGPCCYEVDRAVLDPLRAALGPVDGWVTPHGAGRWLLDLWAVNEARLAAVGVDPARIANARLCTGCRSDLFHSYRRGSGGRMVTLAVLPRQAERVG
jgi:purine-nucleoside/S-methyl-5'-thioadenosine phosphorylase / adenosine deaminase